MPKLFGLDGSTVRQIKKLFALDGATPRRVKKLFGNDGSVRLIFEDFSTFTISGTSNLIQSPVNEVIEFGFRTDFNAGGTDVNINNSGSGDVNNIGGISGLSIDVDSSHTFTTTVTAPHSAGFVNLGGHASSNNNTFRSNRESGPMFLTHSLSISNIGKLASIMSGNFTSNPNRATSANWGGQISSWRLKGSIHFGVNSGTLSNLSGRLRTEVPTNQRRSSNGNLHPSGDFFRDSGDSTLYRTAVTRTSNELRYNGAGNQGSNASARPFIRIQTMGVSPYNPIGNIGVFYGHTFGGGGLTGNFSQNFKYPGDTSTSTTAGRRARVVNGSNRPFTVTGGGLTAGGNFTTGTLNAGASTGFITANSTNEAHTLTGVAQKNPATFSIANADNSITVSGTFGDGENATQARDRIQSVLNGNSTFQGKFNTGVDVDKTISGVAHKVVRFTSDDDENTQDFTITVTQNDGSNTTPYEDTITQGAEESIQTVVTVVREREGSQVSTATAISSQASADTAGAEIAANTSSDITYDASTNKLKVQDQDATVSITNNGSLAASKD